MSKERLLSALDESESAGSVNNFDNARIKKIREDFNKLRDRLLKPKTEEIKRHLYEIENKKNLSKSKIKRIEENLLDLEKSFFKFKKFYYYNDIEYKRIRDVKNLFNEVALSGIAFNQSNDEDYYKPIKTNSAFNGSNIEYQSKGGKDKNLSIKEYLYMIITHLRDVINDHKAHGKVKVHSSNDYETEGEWKIQSSMEINFVSSKDSDEIRIMHTNSDDIEILMGSEKMILLKNFFNLIYKNIKKD